MRHRCGGEMLINSSHKGAGSEPGSAFLRTPPASFFSQCVDTQIYVRSCMHPQMKKAEKQPKNNPRLSEYTPKSYITGYQLIILIY